MVMKMNREIYNFVKALFLYSKTTSWRSRRNVYLPLSV